MKIKSFLIMVLSLISLTVAAQNGGIKGKVVSRATRTAIDGVKVTLTPGNVTTTTDEKGNFIFENLYVIIGNKKKLLRDNWRILVRNLQQTFQNNNKSER